MEVQEKRTKEDVSCHTFCEEKFLFISTSEEEEEFFFPEEMTAFNSYGFQVNLELLVAIVSRDFGGEELHLVHEGHQRDSRATPHARATRHQQGAARVAQDAVHSSHVVQNFLEYDDVQLTVLSTWITDQA